MCSCGPGSGLLVASCMQPAVYDITGAHKHMPNGIFVRSPVECTTLAQTGE